MRNTSNRTIELQEQAWEHKTKYRLQQNKATDCDITNCRDGEEHIDLNTLEKEL